MSVNSPPSAQQFWLRLIRRFLARQAGSVKGMEEALRLRRLMRFIGLVAALILMPSMLLAYFGISSIQGQESEVIEDAEQQAEGVGDAFWAQIARGFEGFENGVRTRLEAGRSPLESPQELHPHLLLSLRLDTKLNVRAPFSRGQPSSGEPVDFLFDEASMRAAAAERRGEEPGVVSDLYLRASRKARTRQATARLLFDSARVLASSGRVGEASTIYDRILARYGQVRDPWGFRMQDLVALEQAERALSTRSDADRLRALVDSLLDARWTIGEGGESAIARRALSRLEPFTDAEWVAATRARIDARTRMLFWAEQLISELDGVLEGGTALRVDEGKMRWVPMDKGLWALTWWGNELYAFALNQTAVINEIRTLAGGLTQPASPVVGRILGPNADPAGTAFTRRSLAPWLSELSLVVTARDPTALAAQQAARRNRRVVIIVLAVLMIVLGALATGRLVGNELQHARMKADFAANVSHELRSPITQIRLKAESLLLGLSETEEEREHDYKTIVRESERLSRLVDNVLDFSAIERGAKRYHMVLGRIEETLQSALDSVESSAELQERRIQVDIEMGLPRVKHDTDAVAQCLINLMSNAAKYSSAGDQIGIQVRAKSGGVLIQVSDQGIGIPEADLRQIFEPFYRGKDATVRRRKGTGIGLAITRYIVGEHKGRIDVVSREGEGSTFSMWFPADLGGIQTG